MSALSDTLRQVRELKGWAQPELAFKAQTDPSSVSRHERGQAMSTETLEAYVRATGVPLVVTPDGWGAWEARDGQIAFYGPAPCGAPLYLEEVEPETIELGDLIGVPLIPGRHFLLRADGDSMKPWINDGDLMVIDRQRVPAINDIVSANWNGGLTVKRIAPHPQTGEPALLPDNPAHDPIEIGEEDEVQVIGVVVGVVRKYLNFVSPDPIAKAQQTRRRRG